MLDEVLHFSLMTSHESWVLNRVKNFEEGRTRKRASGGAVSCVCGGYICSISIKSFKRRQSTAGIHFGADDDADDAFCLSYVITLFSPHARARLGLARLQFFAASPCRRCRGRS
jgi:hypothetical protein